MEGLISFMQLSACMDTNSSTCLREVKKKGDTDYEGSLTCVVF